MIKSMTGYAEASGTSGMITAEVVIRSYNSRYLDIALHLPEVCIKFEDKIKKLVKEQIVRGRIEIRISVKDEADDAIEFELDEKKALAYFKTLSRLKKNLSLESEISLDHFLNVRDIIKPCSKQTDPLLLWSALQGAMDEALKSLNTMRLQEGKNLAEDLNSRLFFIEDKLDIIQKQADIIPEIYRQKLTKRIASLTSDIESLDPVRLAQEAAILADKSDISEEIVRSRSHIQQFKEILKKENESEGRKLNFLIQEFNREFNTMGAKAGKVELSHIIVDIKSELEKIREQIQNIE
ncbi:MAG: YicC family protein [Nitrospiraceae bacterium]|nr:YicC family protein [Nitrospiraceae bacterium]